MLDTVFPLDATAMMTHLWTGKHSAICGLALLTIFSCCALASGQQSGSEALVQLEASVPATAEAFSLETAKAVARLAPLVEDWAHRLAADQSITRGDQLLQRTDQVLSIKYRVDELLQRTLSVRGDFSVLKASTDRRDRMCGYLQVTSTLFDLSGRLRYLLFDSLAEVDYLLSEQSSLKSQLVDLLIARRSSIGAVVLVESLFDPPPEQEKQRLFRRRVTENRSGLKIKILRLAALTGERETLPAIVDFAKAKGTQPHLVIAAVGTIRQLGVPQNPRPGQESKLPQEITAAGLEKILRAIDVSGLDNNGRTRRDELLEWAAALNKQGIQAHSYQLGRMDIQPGDWLLMRNPSPYNLFTDLSPGLFTHVGIVTDETGSDGRRRFVLVDLPERGTTLQATPFDAFVRRSLHYVVLRHDDPAVGKKMAQVARSIIGNPTEFDLNFRTDRVEKLRGKPLAGTRIHTYCAGLLLLCAQETTAQRSSFFPVEEYPAGGKTVENLAKLGFSFGDRFISPTGALFSAHMKMVGRRDPMYDPHREIEEAIYNHFADRLIDHDLSPSPDLYQSLRLKLAQASKTNPLLAKAIAQAAGVSESLDLVAAAKAAAVVEALDEIARSNSAAFRGARESLRAGPANQLKADGFSSEEIAAIGAYRKRHAELYASWASEQISPRRLRIDLVKYYIEKGQRQLDERFFHAAGK